MLKLLGIFTLSLLAVGSAQAMQPLPPWAHSNPPPSPSGPVTAPEIDAAGAVSALTLLAGGIAVIRGRRSKRDK